MGILDYVSALLTLAGVALTILTLQRLISGPWRHYLFLTLLLTLNLLTVVPWVSSLVSLGNWLEPKANQMFWYVALGAQLSTFVFVIQMIQRVASQLPNTRSVVRMVILGAVFLVSGSFLAHYGPKINLMLAFVTRDLSFFAAAGNMLLWSYILRLRKRDSVLMSVCAGLGIQCCGDAIGQSIRTLAPSLRPGAELFMSIASVLTCFIWYRAFHKPVRTAERQTLHEVLPTPPEHHDQASFSRGV